jgi:hypothetical protein
VGVLGCIGVCWGALGERLQRRSREEEKERERRGGHIPAVQLVRCITRYRHMHTAFPGTPFSKT